MILRKAQKSLKTKGGLINEVSGSKGNGDLDEGWGLVKSLRNSGAGGRKSSVVLSGQSNLLMSAAMTNDGKQGDGFKRRSVMKKGEGGEDGRKIIKFENSFRSELERW